jgi:eukaryotic-like serine/threonine-protein kinase
MNPVPKALSENVTASAGSGPGEFPEDPRLVQAVQEYLSQLEAGHRPDRQEFLGRYPDLAGPLAQCLDGLELVHKAATQEKRPASALAFPADGPDESLSANALGDFQIVREIGRGGMGTVYEAVQLSLGRRVALKVLPFAATFDAKHLQRFHNEALAAARLHHTNIVPIYAVGCERGVHFYAMQLIEGHSLAEIIRQVRRETGRPETDAFAVSHAIPPGGHSLEQSAAVAPSAAADQRSSPQDTLGQVSLALSTYRSNKQREYYRAAVRLIVQAAEAVEHAHEFGIVHRDIKPANLLVDLYGRLWVTDFGLAQFHTEANLTRTGDIIGTLRYMSPEQASGQRILVDQRTDVYSLGATLYELVILEPIFPGRSSQELLHQITHDEPRAPRSLDKTVPVELETIILKCVSKNPAERYSSARELAADLERYLEDKPVLARRPGMIDRARKWSRRHPSIVAGGILLLLLSIIGLVVNNWMIAKEQAKTAKRAEEAEARLQLARRAVDEMIQLADADFDFNPSQQTLRRKLLEAALAYYQEFIEQRRDDPNAQAELEATRRRARTVLANLALMQGAWQHLLLAEPAVQDDLQLSPDQRRRIGEVIQDIGGNRARPPGDSHESNGAGRTLVEEVKAHETAIANILAPDQLCRLRQIALQATGPKALCEPEVIAALALTTDQQKRIRMIERDSFFGEREHHRTGKIPADPDRKTREQTVKAAVLQAEGVLTAQQAKRWKAMVGKPFTGPLPESFPGPPRPFEAPGSGPRR